MVQGSFFTRFDKGPNISWMSADGSGEPEGVLERDNWQSPTSVSSNGKVLVFEEWTKRGDMDIFTLPLDGKAKPEPFHVTQFNERHRSFHRMETGLPSPPIDPEETRSMRNAIRQKGASSRSQQTVADVRSGHPIAERSSIAKETR